MREDGRGWSGSGTGDILGYTWEGLMYGNFTEKDGGEIVCYDCGDGKCTEKIW